MPNRWRDPTSRKRRLTSIPTATNWNTLINYWAETPDFPGYVPEDYPGEPMRTAQLQAMLQEAVKYLGYSYKWGGKTPPYFDCSGYVGWCYKFAGIIPESVQSFTGTLHDYCTEVAEQDALPGDLVFWNGRDGTTWANNAHVAIYIGNAMILDCAGPGVDYRPVNWHSTVAEFAGYFRVPGAQE